MNEQARKFLLPAIILINVLALTAGAYFLYRFSYQKGYVDGLEIGKASVNAEVGAVVGNPLENLPSTNPFGDVVNPFKDAYKNPFK